MLIDVRTYKCKPNTLKKHLELYEKFGKKPQVKNLGHPLLFLTTETGDPNDICMFGPIRMLLIGKIKEENFGRIKTG